MTWWLASLFVVLLIAAMVVVVAVRTARVVLPRERVEELVDAGVAGAAAALRTIDEQERSAAVAQVLVPTAATLVGWLVVAGVGSLIDANPRFPVLFVATLLAALSVGLLCESVPRAVALAAPERVMLLLAWPHRVLAVLLAPVAVLCSAVAAGLLFPVGLWVDGGRRRAHTVDELAELVTGMAEEDVPGAGRDLLAGAFGFLDVRVRDVMARREDIVTVPRTSTVREAEELVHRSGHSRVLVVGEDGTVTGFLHAKDLIALPPERQDAYLPPGLVRVALRVGPDDRLDDVLPRMRRARRHVAVVEHGGEVLGLVTLEDVLEAIVGEIHDESDVVGS